MDSASSFSASRSVVTARGVAADLLDLPCLAATGRGRLWNLEGSSARDRFHVLSYAAITGAEGVTRSSPICAGRRWPVVRPSRPLRGGGRLLRLEKRRVRAGVEVDDDRRAAQLGERHLVPVLVGEGEVGRLFACFDHAANPSSGRHRAGQDPGGCRLAVSPLRHYDRSRERATPGSDARDHLRRAGGAVRSRLRDRGAPARRSPSTRAPTATRSAPTSTGSTSPIPRSRASSRSRSTAGAATRPTPTTGASGARTPATTTSSRTSPTAGTRPTTGAPAGASPATGSSSRRTSRSAPSR